MITTELGFDVEETKALEQPESWAINHKQYEASVDWSLKEAFEQEPTRANATALSLSYIRAIFLSLRPGAAIVINSSTGKDSSLVTALYIEAALKWKAEGNIVPATTIAIADTGAEFPMMNSRLLNESNRITAYSQKQGLPIKVEIVRARAKKRILAQIIGNGRPLPALVSGKASNASGAASTNWCMDYVKGEPLSIINKMLSAENPMYIQLIGTRYGESSARDVKVTRYSRGLARGLTRLGGLSRNEEQSDDDEVEFGSDARLAGVPIMDWPTKLVEEFLRCGELPWNYASAVELGKIYSLASTKGEQDATQCDLTLTKDGGVSNSCSDLSGARMGCFMCVKSINKSLTNMHRNESREARKSGSQAFAKHRWIRGFHKYLIGLHARYSNATSKNPVSGRLSGQRVKIDSIVKALGKDTDVLFCKNLPFQERARLLLLLFRAEIESGYKLVDDEELAMIQLYWKKAGVYHVHYEEIRKDALEWKKTGKPSLSYLKFGEMIDRTDIAQGIAHAAYFHTDELAVKNNIQPLKILHMLTLRSHGTPLLPIPRAYIFERRERSNNECLIMVTDTPAVIAANTNNNLLNGIAPFAWILRGTRELTEWEGAMFDCGRNFFYSHRQEETNEAIEEYINCEQGIREKDDRSYLELRRDGEVSARFGFFPHTRPLKLRRPSMRDSIIANVEAGRHCGVNSEPLDDHYALNQSLGALVGKITMSDLKEFLPIVSALAEISDITEEDANEAAHLLESFCDGKWHMLENLAGEENSAEKKQFQAGLMDLAKRQRLVQRTEDDFNLYQQLMGKLMYALKIGRINGALVSKLAFIARYERFDPDYAEKLAGELIESLRIKKPIVAKKIAA